MAQKLVNIRMDEELKKNMHSCAEAWKRSMQVRVSNMTSLRWIDDVNRLVYRIRDNVLKIISLGAL